MRKADKSTTEGVAVAQRVAARVVMALVAFLVTLKRTIVRLLEAVVSAKQAIDTSRDDRRIYGVRSVGRHYRREACAADTWSFAFGSFSEKSKSIYRELTKNNDRFIDPADWVLSNKKINTGCAENKISVSPDDVIHLTVCALRFAWLSMNPIAHHIMAGSGKSTSRNYGHFALAKAGSGGRPVGTGRFSIAT